MEIYFCGKYIYIDGDEKEVERDMYASLPYFQGLMIMMDMKREKTKLKISSHIYP